MNIVDILNAIKDNKDMNVKIYEEDNDTVIEMFKNVYTSDAILLEDLYCCGRGKTYKEAVENFLIDFDKEEGIKEKFKIK